MLKIDGNAIYLTRGDTAFLEIALTDENGDPYIPSAEDTVTFRLKKSATSKVVLVEKTIDTTTMVMELDENDTKDLKFDTYKYEIELTTADGNYHFTAIENEDFEIGPELELHDG